MFSQLLDMPTILQHRVGETVVGGGSEILGPMGFFDFSNNSTFVVFCLEHIQSGFVNQKEIDFCGFAVLRRNLKIHQDFAGTGEMMIQFGKKQKFAVVAFATCIPFGYLLPNIDAGKTFVHNVQRCVACVVTVVHFLPPLG